MPSATANRFHFLNFESWYFGPNANPTFPQTVPLPGPAGASYADCADCVLMDEDCDNMGANCARTYYVQAGSMTIRTATRNVAAGTLDLTATNMTLNEWAFTMTSDMAVPNGRCVTIATATLNSTWNRGGGDGGVDGGADSGVVVIVDAGTIDAGTVDAGPIDAGIRDAGIADAGDGG